MKGTYNWTADYSGDDNNNKASSGCGEEALVVEAAAPTVLTEIHLSPDPEEDPVTVVGGDTHVDLGSTVHDQGTVTAPAVLGTPTGSVDFKFYKGDDCAAGEVTADPADVQVGSTSNVLLANGVAHPSADFGPLGAGSYYFTAHFKTGNENVWSNSDSTCEPLTVDKAQLTIVTQIHNAAHGNVGDATHVPLGSVVHDTATVTGAVPGFNPSGAITFTLDGNLVTQINPAELGFTATTVDSAPLGAGDYLYRASVAGDDNYIGDRSGPEPLTVDKGTLSIVTKIHDTSHAVVTFVPVNGIVHDTAHITGANSNFPVDTSKVSFTFYNTIDCTGTGADAGNNGGALDSSSGDPRSDVSAALASGAYSYNAAFAGDGNYNPITAANVACEPLSVRTFGKTMGYWHNQNGQAVLAANNAFSAANAVKLGETDVSPTNQRCNVLVNSATRSLTILPTPNGASLIPQCSTNAKLDTGQVNSFNTLLVADVGAQLQQPVQDRVRGSVDRCHGLRCLCTR